MHTYYFSSYGVYLGNYKDDYGILNTDFILSQFGNSPDMAQIQYVQFVTSCNNVTQKDKQFEIIDSYIYNEPYEYRNERFIYYRDLTPGEVIGIVADAFDIQTLDFIKIKYSHGISDFRAISVFLMRCLCDYTYKDICKELGNLTLSQVANLCSRGFELIQSDPKYNKLLPQLLKKIRVA